MSLSFYMHLQLPMYVGGLWLIVSDLPTIQRFSSVWTCRLFGGSVDMVDMVIIVDMVDPVFLFCFFRNRSDLCLALSKTHSPHVVELEWYDRGVLNITTLQFSCGNSPLACKFWQDCVFLKLKFESKLLIELKPGFIVPLQCLTVWTNDIYWASVSNICLLCSFFYLFSSSCCLSLPLSSSPPHQTEPSRLELDIVANYKRGQRRSSQAERVFQHCS